MTRHPIAPRPAPSLSCELEPAAPPREPMPAELQLHKTPEGLPLPFVHHDTEDRAELERLVAEWERTHGPYSHVLFQGEPGLVAMPRPVSAVLVLRLQPVLVVPELDRGHVHPITPQMVQRTASRAEELPFFGWCLVPLACITQQRADMWRGVPMRKVGVNTLVRTAAETGLGGLRP